jgi:methionyl-tRNA formyltransferase
MKIGFLSVFHDVFLGHLIRECAGQGMRPDAVFFDALDLSDKDRRLFEERTKGRIPPLTPYDWEDEQIPCHFVQNHNGPGCVALVQHLDLDLLVNAGTPRILKTSILKAPRVGVVNCHPGLLPQFRGCTCVEWAILLDEPVGNTVHFMVEGIDEGPIVLQEAVDFSAGDDYVAVRLKTYWHSLKLMAQGLKKIVRENLRPENLPPQGPGRYFPVMAPGDLAQVKDKLAKGLYKFQREAS